MGASARTTTACPCSRNTARHCGRRRVRQSEVLPRHRQRTPARATKEGPGCAGIYTAHAAIEFYAAAFEEAGALDKLEGFASEFGPRFYGLPVNQDTITLVRQEWTVPETLPFGRDKLVPLRAGETLPWKLL
jgi:dihydroorotase